MPVATADLPNLEQVNATLRQLDELEKRFLDECAVIAQGIRQARASIEADLRLGVEARPFAQSLITLKAYGSDVLKVYAAIKKPVANGKTGTDTLAALI